MPGPAQSASWLPVRVIAGLLVSALLLGAAHAAGHAHAPSLDAAASIAADLGHGHALATVDEDCALCSARSKERDVALRVASLETPRLYVGGLVQPAPRADASTRFARTGPARAPPHVA